MGCWRAILLSISFADITDICDDKNPCNTWEPAYSLTDSLVTWDDEGIVPYGVIFIISTTLGMDELCLPMQKSQAVQPKVAPLFYFSSVFLP